jgi:hypothetical protein
MHPCWLPGNQRKLINLRGRTGLEPAISVASSRGHARFSVSNNFTLEVVHINMKFLHIEGGCRADEYRNRRSIGERGHA